MASPIFLYPSLTEEMKNEGIFYFRKYEVLYTDNEGCEKELTYETAEIDSSVNILKTDGVWNADKYNLCLKRKMLVSKITKLFGPEGIACRKSTLGVAVRWASTDSRQRGAITVLRLKADENNTSAENEMDIRFPVGKLRGDVQFSVILYIAEAGEPDEDETHLANEAGLVLGEIDSFILRLDGTGSLFPVFEVYEKDKPLWYVRCDWTDPVSDSFAETVSINLNAAHKNYRYIDRKQKTFNPQLLVEVMSSALCNIIEKIRSEKYLDQILADDEPENGSVGAVIRYFSDTLEWDMSTPDKLSVSTRLFFEGRIAD